MLGAKSLMINAALDHIADERDAQAREIRELRERLFKAQKKATFRMAAAEALGELADEIKDEIGGFKPRRLSDPKNQDLRNEFYVDRMQKKVDSESTLNLPAPDGSRIKVTDEMAKDFKSRKQLR